MNPFGMLLRSCSEASFVWADHYWCMFITQRNCVKKSGCEGRSRREPAGVMTDSRMSLFYILLLLEFPASFVVSGDDDQAAALESLKPTTDGSCVVDTWRSIVHQGGVCPTTFCGVSCSDGSVVGLDLSGQGLQGTIPPDMSVGTLRSLTSLDLSNNLLSGELPEDLGNLANLQYLDLSRNKFTGYIPRSLSSLRNLLYLNISFNKLQGVVPPELSSLDSLKSLDLQSNQLSGELNPALLSLSSLTTVDLSNNKLSGFLPWQPNDTLALLKIVEHVNLSHNQLTGPLAPAKFISVFAEKLKVLDMSDNQLSGNLPDFEFVISLTTLRLNGNLFTGAVPPTLVSATLGLLEELDLSSNNLSGVVPRVLSTSLKVINISLNALSGGLPDKVGLCSVVDLSHNNLNGDLSVLQYWSDTVEVLDVSFNRLSGELIDDVGVFRFVRLRSLNLSHNGLFGQVSANYGLLPKIDAIDLSFNRLSGVIPPTFFNSSTISTLVLSNNLLAGNLSLPNGPLSPVPQMVTIDLSNNKLFGTVPVEISVFQELQRLNLSNNELSGQMPYTLCNLTLLKVLDLSANLLSGSIPAALSSSLETLQLSDNNLSGQIPRNLKKFPNASFFPGNGGLFALWPLSTNQGAPLISSFAEHKRSLSVAVKVGLIGGCLAGFTLLIVIGLLVYYGHMAIPLQFGVGRPKEYATTKSPKDVQHGHNNTWNPCAAYLAFPDHVTNHNALGINFSDDLHSNNHGKNQERFLARTLKMENPLTPSGDTELSCASTQSKSFLMPSEPPRVLEDLASSPSVVLKVQSPDKLAGDLHFLDKTLRFTAEELSRAPAEVLGRSSHGTSYRATLDTGHVLTVKWLREGLAKSKRDFAKEANRFAKVRHPNLVPLRGYYWGPREHEKLILFDFVSARSLAAHLADRTGQRCTPLNWEQRLGTAVDIARGLVYLHDERNLPHGNLKATNVLIDEATCSARLADYGLHQLMTSEGTANQILNAGAFGYRAPEFTTMKKLKPTFKGDIYAFGVLVLEILTGQGAGDIISGQSGAVDLTDWVQKLASEVRSVDCLDPMLVASSLEPLAGVEDMFALALKCISQHPTDRPAIREVYEELMVINV